MIQVWKEWAKNIKNVDHIHIPKIIWDFVPWIDPTLPGSITLHVKNLSYGNLRNIIF
jgi:hypothetical protein